MQQLIQVIEQVQLVAGSNVDRSFGQGLEAILTQRKLHFGNAKIPLLVDKFIESCKEDIELIQTWVKPYILTDDYLLFLKLYGSLQIINDIYTLMLNGIGPMVEEWYGFLRGDGIYIEPKDCGFLQIGSLGFKQKINGGYRSYLFLLDLTATKSRGNVIGIGPCPTEAVGIAEIASNPTKYPQFWKVLAPSFTDFLALITKTKGTLGYSLTG